MLLLKTIQYGFNIATSDFSGKSENSVNLKFPSLQILSRSNISHKLTNTSKCFPMFLQVYSKQFDCL